ncbi:hypothetical protein FB451DRAFT_77400 [Mycena latifolia]|nr:hypothetical protein FB451DRAFT_77400 [Mycena latifolia]
MCAMREDRSSRYVAHTARSRILARTDREGKDRRGWIECTRQYSRYVEVRTQVGRCLAARRATRARGALRRAEGRGAGASRTGERTGGRAWRRVGGKSETTGCGVREKRMECTPRSSSPLLAGRPTRTARCRARPAAPPVQSRAAHWRPLAVPARRGGGVEGGEALVQMCDDVGRGDGGYGDGRPRRGGLPERRGGQDTGWADASGGDGWRSPRMVRVATGGRGHVSGCGMTAEFGAPLLLDAEAVALEGPRAEATAGTLLARMLLDVVLLVDDFPLQRQHGAFRLWR